jgi:hypothetical protein
VDTARAIAWIQADRPKTKRNISVPLNGDALKVLAEQQPGRRHVPGPGLDGLRFRSSPHVGHLALAGGHPAAGTAAVQRLGQLADALRRPGPDLIAAYADKLGALWHSATKENGR